VTGDRISADHLMGLASQLRAASEAGGRELFIDYVTGDRHVVTALVYDATGLVGAYGVTAHGSVATASDAMEAWRAAHDLALREERMMTPAD
jgi:hypothetical protein